MVGGDDRGKTLYPAGETIDNRYEIVRRIGYGSTSDVYEARDLKQDCSVALKVLNNRRLRDPQARTRFHREASVQALIHHANVAATYANGITAANEPYLVLELFSGRCLRTVLNQETRVDVTRACSYVLQALDGLAACHAAGVRHRDLKPENMMLRAMDDPIEQVVLIDFGFASFEGERRLTAEGFVVGSISYIAPERLQGEAGDARADLYAIGAILFELLAGEAPFEGDDISVAHQHLQQPPPSVRERAPDAGISAELDAVVLNALAKDPAERYQSAEAMADALARTIVRPAGETVGRKAPAHPVGATLWYCDADGVEKKHPIGEEPILIGRAPECTIRSDDPLVSRQHARLSWGEDGQYWIEDLASTNGVWVGVEEIERASMPPDEIVLVGSLILQYRPDAGETQPRDLRPGMHTRLWRWLRAERAVRAATQAERNALGRRVGELHQAVEQLSRASGAGVSTAAKKLANELQLLRDSARELRAGMVAAEADKDQLATDYNDARREFSKALQKHMANTFAAQSEAARVTEELETQRIVLEDHEGRLRTREAEVHGLREDLQALSGVATVGAQQETLALVAAQAEKAKLAERVGDLEGQVDDLRRDVADKVAELREVARADQNDEALEQRVVALTEELEQLRWTQHQGHAAQVRARLQLESALAEVGELRSRGTDTIKYNSESLSRLELDNAAMGERIAELEGELDTLVGKTRTTDAEVVRLRENLLTARAEVEAAWAEVEHLRGQIDPSE